MNNQNSKFDVITEIWVRYNEHYQRTLLYISKWTHSYLINFSTSWTCEWNNMIHILKNLFTILWMFYSPSTLHDRFRCCDVRRKSLNDIYSTINRFHKIVLLVVPTRSTMNITSISTSSGASELIFFSCILQRSCERTEGARTRKKTSIQRIQRNTLNSAYVDACVSDSLPFVYARTSMLAKTSGPEDDVDNSTQFRCTQHLRTGCEPNNRECELWNAFISVSQFMAPWKSHSRAVFCANYRRNHTIPFTPKYDLRECHKSRTNQPVGSRYVGSMAARSPIEWV